MNTHECTIIRDLRAFFDSLGIEIPFFFFFLDEVFVQQNVQILSI